MALPHARGDGPHHRVCPRLFAYSSPRPWGWSARPEPMDREHALFPTPVGMVRPNLFDIQPATPLPHARGDGPLPASWSPHNLHSSPRPWGWSVAHHRRIGSARLFPTPVGMVRELRLVGGFHHALPHARGDGPADEHFRVARDASSPRPWGWSAVVAFTIDCLLLFPTPVGMVRQERPMGADAGTLPHARGDGPVKQLQIAGDFTSSPRPWGWSGTHRRHRTGTGLFPTPVGMVRPSKCRRRWGRALPHARGDGPSVPHVESVVFSSSPRPWGWSNAALHVTDPSGLFPTPVGMVRTRPISRHTACALPHARGDGPRLDERTRNARDSSPRPWGWSFSLQIGEVELNLFPTPVGMVRPGGTGGGCCCPLPHARGDGPMSISADSDEHHSSPRPWGWSGEECRPACHRSLFPTPVGWSFSPWPPWAPCELFPTPVGMVLVVGRKTQMQSTGIPWAFFP